jgi:hypothetical protein
LIEPGNIHFRIHDDHFILQIADDKLIFYFNILNEIVIPGLAKTIGSSCFERCDSLSSISFESPSSLKRIESDAFSFSKLNSIVIPCQVEILGSECFSCCESFSSILFESPSSLKRIESNSFSSSKLASIVIPCQVEIIESSCFENCESFSSISFESPSSLKRIESNAFSFSELRSIVIPCQVEILGSSCFSYCKSFSSVLFEIPSHLRRIGGRAFRNTRVSVIALPSSICYIPNDAFSDDCQISFIPGDVSYDLGQSSLNRCDGFTFDSKTIINRDAILRVLAGYDLDLCSFERDQNPETCELFGTSMSLYRRKSDGLEIAIKEIPNFDSHRDERSFESLEKLTHLKHPSIVSLFGIVFPKNSTVLTIATMYCRNGSLKQVLANPPSWWTPTAKSKAIAGIVLGMRFAHSLGCAHERLKPSNILFDENEHVQIVDFCSNHIQGRARKEADDELEALMMDVVAFCSILFEILVGRSVVAQICSYNEFRIELVDNGEQVVIPSLIPSFLGFLFAGKGFALRSVKPSFEYIYHVLKKNSFDIVEGNDVNEVLRFVSSLEASEY